MKYLSTSFLLLYIVTIANTTTAQQTETDQPPPVELTTEEDHRRTMELLGIDSLRPGVNGSDPKAPNYVNYDEANANPYPHLPDPLLTKGREEGTTPEMWQNERRPELIEFFDREIYSRVPEGAEEGVPVIMQFGFIELPPFLKKMLEETKMRMKTMPPQIGINW